jgi:hypothetical protein
MLDPIVCDELSRDIFTCDPLSNASVSETTQLRRPGGSFVRVMLETVKVLLTRWTFEVNLS